MYLGSPCGSGHYLVVPKFWAQHHFLGCPPGHSLLMLITLPVLVGSSSWMLASGVWVGEQTQSGCDRWPWLLCSGVTSQEVPGLGFCHSLSFSPSLFFNSLGLS